MTDFRNRPHHRPRNLVIVRAGRNPLSQSWGTARRDFDVIHSFYVPLSSTPAANVVLPWSRHIELREGPKWTKLYELLKSSPEVLDQYDAFWFPDDDIETSAENVNRMFALFHAFNMQLAQPALTRDSYYSWRVLLQEHDTVIRFNNFVEPMVPIFSRDALKACLHTFNESESGWGLDWVWPKLVGRGRGGCIGIIDATPVRHTRPLGGELYTVNNLKYPMQDVRKLEAQYKFKVEPSRVETTVLGRIGLKRVGLLERLINYINRLRLRKFDDGEPHDWKLL